MVEGFARPVPDEQIDLGACRLADESATSKWRTWTDRWSVPIGESQQAGDGLAFSIAPGEWIELDVSEPAADAVDISHVRAMLRLSGAGSRNVLEHLCGLDLSEAMTPNGAAARTLVDDVATELVRDDVADELSYLLLVSRSFARHLWDRITEAAAQ